MAKAIRHAASIEYIPVKGPKREQHVSHSGPSNLWPKGAGGTPLSPHIALAAMIGLSHVHIGPNASTQEYRWLPKRLGYFEARLALIASLRAF